MSITTEVVRLVWDDKEGVAIAVGPDADSLGLVRVRTHDLKADEYFGRFDVTFPPSLTRAIGEAMVLAADEAERAK